MKLHTDKYAHRHAKRETSGEAKDLLVVADIYAEARERLASFFDFLPAASKERFYNYADSVRKYEEKVREIFSVLGLFSDTSFGVRGFQHVLCNFASNY